jgi:hypothetical protein
MATLVQQVANAVSDSLSEMNNYINLNGKIAPSSTMIKNWHTYDNHRWELVLTGAKAMIECSDIRVRPFVEQDIDMLLNHLTQYDSYADNILYPTPKVHKSLPSAITHADDRKYAKTIRTRTFRTMLNLREALCDTLGIDLPNEDSSIGKLKPNTYEALFH